MTEWFFRAALLLSVIFSVKAVDGPILDLPSGKIQGKARENFYEFKAIPYADPPIGENRFEPPKPFSSKWEGVRNAALPNEVCIQWDELYPGLLHGSEDCLYLNVYTPRIEGDNLYPVIVNIHGGAFMFGSSESFDPLKIMETGKFVVVQFNYRVGPLGFLSTEDNEISGNMGLKDQLLAMKWVKENIHIFKGDSKQIMLIGDSAGGVSVHYHLLSPKSQGLFQVAISHSGTAFCAWASIHNSLERAKKLAAHLGCPTDNTKLLKECLKLTNASYIVGSVQIFQPYMYNPFTVFGPTIESPNSTDAFISEDIEQIIKEGKSGKVPWLVSFTTDEGGYNAAKLLKQDSSGKSPIDSFGDKWPQLAPLMLFFNETIPVDKHTEVAQKLKEKYLGNEDFSTANYRKVQKMFTDQLFLIGIEKSIKLHAEFSKTPVFVYSYGRPSSYGVGQLLSQRQDIEFGAVHGDDFGIIFIPSFVITEEDEQVSKRLINLYDSFIKAGVPKYGTLDIPSTSGEKELKILQINGLNDYDILLTDTLTENH